MWQERPLFGNEATNNVGSGARMGLRSKLKGLVVKTARKVIRREEPTPSRPPAPRPPPPVAVEREVPGWKDDGETPLPDEPRMLLLYKDDYCDYCKTVVEVIEELGMIVPMKDIRKDPPARNELWDITRRFTVPCLFIDDVPLHESERIVEWIRAYNAEFS